MFRCFHKDWPTIGTQIGLGVRLLSVTPQDLKKFHKHSLGSSQLLHVHFACFEALCACLGLPFCFRILI